MAKKFHRGYVFSSVPGFMYYIRTPGRDDNLSYMSNIGYATSEYDCSLFCGITDFATMHAVTMKV